MAARLLRNSASMCIAIGVQWASAGVFGPGPGGLIPDNSPAGIVSTISIPASAAVVGSVNSVTLVFGSPAHSWAGDLHAQLTSPSGQVVHLFSRVGSTSDNLFGDDSDLGGAYVFTNIAQPTAFAQAAATAGPRARIAEGTYERSTHALAGGVPAGQLFAGFDVFAGEPIGGDWRLTVSDHAEGDGGSLVSWSLDITTSLVVTNVFDGSPPPAGSLRAVVAAANAISGGAVIEFDGALVGTITLSAGAISLAQSTTIQGPGANRLAVSGNGVTRVFAIGGGGTTATINDLTIRNGVSSGGTANFGGAILVDSGANLRMNRCIVKDSAISAATFSAGGGLAVGAAGSVELTGCTFNGNTSSASTSSEGAAIYSPGAALTLVNCTISGNTASAGTVSSGGGISSRGPLVLRSCTIAGNSAESGSGVNVLVAAASLTNTIIGANAGEQVNLNVGATLVSLGNNLISDGSSGLVDGVNGDRVGVDPLLAPLADNGGPTPTRALLAGSPAIDAGGGSTGGEPLDQRGLERGTDGNCDAVAAPDIGAFEFKAGSGLSFDGLDDFGLPDPSTSWGLTSGFTIEAWVTPDSFSSPTGATRFVSTRTSAISGFGFGQGAGRLLFTTFGRRDYLTSVAALARGERTHVAVVFDAEFDAHFYVNGQPFETVLGSLPAAPSTSLTIGRNPTITDPQFFDGVLEDVRIWNVVRTAAEIADNYDRAFSSPPPSLLANWPLDDGAGAIAREIVAGRAATLSGIPVWLGTPCATCAADLNGDFRVDLQDLATLLANFGSTEVQREDGDTDGDGDADLADLATLLGEFGATCN